MRTLQHTLESLLDADFDITDQDVMLDALKGLFKFFMTHDQTKSEAELEHLMTAHNCPEASPMRNSKNAKNNIVVYRKKEYGIMSVHFMTYLGGKPWGSQVRFDWLGNEYKSARIGGLDKNNLASISNHRPNPAYKCWLIPQHYFEELFEYAKSIR